MPSLDQHRRLVPTDLLNRDVRLNAPNVPVASVDWAGVLTGM